MLSAPPSFLTSVTGHEYMRQSMYGVSHGARISLTSFDDCRNAALEALQPRAETKRVEGLDKILFVLREMRPPLAMNGNDRGIRKSMRRLDRIVGVHREIERTARARRPREKQHNAGSKPAGHLRYTVVPNC